MTEPAAVSGIAALGLNLPLFLAQLVNFAVILLVWRWVYRRLMPLMEARTKKIEQGLRDADAATVQLQEAEKERQEVLRLARKEGEALLAEMHGQAKQEGVAMVAQARHEAEEEMKTAREKMAHERAEMMSALRLELASLIGLATEKVTQGALKAQDQRALIQKAIEELPKK